MMPLAAMTLSEQYPGDSMKNVEALTVRKFLIPDQAMDDAGDSRIANELDLRACARVHFSSESAEHPIDHLFDGSVGAGASKWVGGRRDRPETILLVFDEPMDLARCAFEAEEVEVARTQKVIAECILPDSDVYRECFIQEFNFAPDGATYQRELIDLNLRAVRRLRFTILADKSGRGCPSLTALRVFSSPW
jgi:hypothetical protein